MDINLIHLLITLITLVIDTGGIYVIKCLNNKVCHENFKNYYEFPKTIVMSLEQLYASFDGVDKKDLTINKLVELTNNKLSASGAETLIEIAIYKVKKFLKIILINNIICRFIQKLLLIPLDF